MVNCVHSDKLTDYHLKTKKKKKSVLHMSGNMDIPSANIVSYCAALLDTQGWYNSSQAETGYS